MRSMQRYTGHMQTCLGRLLTGYSDLPINNTKIFGKRVNNVEFLSHSLSIHLDDPVKKKKNKKK